MFDKMIPILPKDPFIICDLDETLFTRGMPCKFIDLDGFIQLFTHVKGNLIFLTKHANEKEIRDKFKHLKLNYDDFTVLYTSDSKGAFLKSLSYPPRTVFIDNSVRQIKSVRKHCPDIMCIHFTPK